MKYIKFKNNLINISTSDLLIDKNDTMTVPNITLFVNAPNIALVTDDEGSYLNGAFRRYVILDAEELKDCAIESEYEVTWICDFILDRIIEILARKDVVDLDILIFQIKNTEREEW
jgi:hypothetical protein